MPRPKKHAEPRKVVKSPALSLTTSDIPALIKSAGISAFAVFATMMITQLGNVDFGQYTPLVTGVLALLGGFINQYIKETTK